MYDALQELPNEIKCPSLDKNIQQEMFNSYSKNNIYDSQLNTNSPDNTSPNKILTNPKNQISNSSTNYLSIKKQLNSQPNNSINDINVSYISQLYNIIKDSYFSNDNYFLKNPNFFLCSFSQIANIFISLIDKIIEKACGEKINQYISHILFLEQSIRYHIYQNFMKQTQINILENDIETYVEMEQEFDAMKEKFKYENGKFLHNEKKENEILILRAENSNLKKFIDKTQKTIEAKEKQIESYKKSATIVSNTNTNSINHDSTYLLHNKSNSINFLKNLTSHNHSSSKQSSKSKNSSNIFITSQRELLNTKLKNKILNMKKVRNLSNLDSIEHITNSILSNMNLENNNNNGGKTFRKSIKALFKNKNYNKIPKHKINSQIFNTINKNLIKKNINKIILQSSKQNFQTKKEKINFKSPCNIIDNNNTIETYDYNEGKSHRSYKKSSHKKTMQKNISNAQISTNRNTSNRKLSERGGYKEEINKIKKILSCKHLYVKRKNK